VGDLDLYAYVFKTPTSHSDPSGEIVPTLADGFSFENPDESLHGRGARG
jgi:hypothetical protein